MTRFHLQLNVRPNRITVSVSIGGEVVNANLRVCDWSQEITSPASMAGVVVHARHLRPDTSALGVRVRQLIDQAPRDDQARRMVGLHLLGTCLHPEGVLETRALTTRDIEQVFAGMLGATFEHCVREYAARATVGDLDLELVKLLTGMSDSEVTHRWHEVKVVEDDLIDLAAKSLMRTYRAVRASGQRFQRALTTVERSELHRVRQAILRRYRNDKLMLRVHALRYSLEGEALHDEVNRAILQALRRVVSSTEARLCEFLYTRFRHTARGPGFNGIVGYRTPLMSLLEHSANTIGQLVACCREQRPLRGPMSPIAVGLQQQLVGLIRAGGYVLTEIRDRERDKKNAQRARRPPPRRSSVSIGRAKALLPWLEHLSDHQRQVVVSLAGGLTVTEVAKDIDKTRQAVQSALRRAEETVRAITRS